MSYVQMPGAEHQKAVRLDDLTVPATVSGGHTVEADWSHLHASTLRNRTGVPGVQIDGYFPSESRLNTHHGWDHDAQFVLRMPGSIDPARSGVPRRVPGSRIMG
jgi:hypothetical protein